MGFVNGTPIQIDSQNAKAIEQFVLNDAVLSFDFASQKPTNSRQLRVDYNSGTSGPIATTCYAIIYVIDEVVMTLICTPDQPFLMQDGKMKVASELVPQKDYLWLMSGELVLLGDAVSGMEKAAIHNISITEQVPASVNGNLIVANSVICGDYALQMTRPTPSS